MVGSLDEVAAWLLEHCQVIREREGRKRALAAVKLALAAARDGDADICRREIIKAAFWWNDGHGAFSLSRAEESEVQRDEARVLGLLAAVRVHGEPMLVAAETGASAPLTGLWVRAKWRGAVHVPHVPIEEVDWSTFGAQSRSPPWPAALWWPCERGASLRSDRVMRAVTYLRLYETMSEQLNTVVVLRRVRERLQEAYRRRWAGADARRAIAKAKAIIRKHLADEERARIDAAAKLEPLPKGLRDLPPEEGLARGWPFLERAATLKWRFETRLGPYPLAHLGGQLNHASSPAELEDLYDLLRRVTTREGRSNTNFAVPFQDSLTMDHWSASTGARLWYRSLHGPNPAREKQFIQQVDAKLRERLRSASKSSPGG